MNFATAQDIATDVLLWLCTQEDLLPVFLGATGADSEQLRSGISDPGLANAGLDFVMMRDETVLDAATALGVPPDRLAMAAAVLAGDAGRHWT